MPRASRPYARARCCCACSSTDSGNTATSARAGAQSWHVQTVAETAQSAVQGLAVYPDSITVDAGDSITWTFPTHDVYTIAFLGTGQTTPPWAVVAGTPVGTTTYDGSAFTHSGFLSNGKSFTLKFTKPGT